MRDSKKKAKSGNGVPASIKFHYIKSENYRNYHVDGAFGGLTPKGYLHMNIFSERHPIPQEETYQVAGGKLTLKSQKGKEGIIRQMECDLIMDYNAMTLIHKWIGERIQEFNEKFHPKK